MKARFVNESIDFERGVDPKNAMGIGLLGKDMKDMSREEQEEYIISCLPILFPNGFKGLVSHDGENWLNPDATGIISDFLSVKKTHPYISPYQLVANYLVSKAMKIKESANFERGKDPKTAMEIGKARKVKAGDEVDVLFRFWNPHESENFEKYKDKVIPATAISDEVGAKLRSHRKVGVRFNIPGDELLSDGTWVAWFMDSENMWTIT